MSGGVDSSVAAAILKQQGYEVIGVFMKLWSEKVDKTDLVRQNLCCSEDAAKAARAVAHKLNIPFYILNLEALFKNKVVDYYLKEYQSGRTPNPCVICNRDIKAEVLLDKVLALEGDYLATGHYAKISCNYQNSKKTPNPNLPKYALLKAKDKTKDQTYFLWTLKQKQLAKMLFPIGQYLKSEVRQMAQKWQLPTAERKESQGVCFIPDRDVYGFLRRHGQRLTQPGDIKDVFGQKIGRHQGLINYTIGQREGLGLGGPKAYYVVKLDSQTNTLILGDNQDLFKRNLIAGDLNWLNQETPERLSEINLGARIRYRHKIETCKLKLLAQGKAKITFDRPQRAITPGQSIVFYQGQMLLGGGIIQGD